MSILQINTALSLAEPLLEQQQQREEDNDNKDSIQHKLVQGELKSRIKFVLLGTLTGFFIQVVSLGAYAFILVHFNGMSLQESGILSMDGFFRSNTPETSRESEFVGRNAVLYTVLSVLTQIDLVVYVLVWVGFTCTMTRSGMKCIRSHFFSLSTTKESKSSLRRRTVFVLGVCFLVGIVLGAFAAWTAIDVYLGFPIPLEPIFATVLLDLALCYMMVKCFDMGGQGKSETKLDDIDIDDDEEDEYQEDGAV